MEVQGRERRTPSPAATDTISNAIYRASGALNKFISRDNARFSIMRKEVATKEGISYANCPLAGRVVTDCGATGIKFPDG